MNALRSFGKQLPPKPKRRIQKSAPDALVHAHAVGHFLHVRAGRFANDRDRVDVGDLQRQERIRRVLDQFGGIDVRDDDGRVERRVNFLHRLHRPLRADADHDAVRLHQIVHRKAFAQELRVADDVKFHLRFAIALDGLGNFIARS